MPALSRSRLDCAFLMVSSKTQRAKLRGSHKWIVGLYLVSIPIASVVWLAGLTWAAIKAIGYALS